MLRRLQFRFLVLLKNKLKTASICFLILVFYIVIYPKKTDEKVQHHPAALPIFYDLNHQQHNRPTSSSTFLEMYNRLNGTYFDHVDSYIEYSVMRLGLVSQNQNVFGPIVNNVSSFRYLINTLSCSQNEKKILILIVSAPKNFHKRHIIRQTWMQHANKFQLSAAFFLGTSENDEIQKRVVEESSVHGDIVMVDAVDGYFRLTLKTVALLNYVNNYCTQAPYIIKSDDDIYINAHNLASLLQFILPPSKPAIYGQPHESRIVIRDQGSWKVDFEVWPWVDYPDNVMSGSHYMMSRAAVGELLAAAQVVPYFIFEDIYLIGLCARKANVSIMTSDRVYSVFQGQCLTARNPCNYVAWVGDTSEIMLSSHKNMEELYENGIDISSVSNDTSFGNGNFSITTLHILD